MEIIKWNRYRTLWHGILYDYLNNLKKYRKGGWICDCGNINPTELTHFYRDDKYHTGFYVCEKCSLEYSSHEIQGYKTAHSSVEVSSLPK